MIKVKVKNGKTLLRFPAGFWGVLNLFMHVSKIPP